MQFKKWGGKIFGVQLNAAEQKAMNAEIDRQAKERMAEWTKKDADEIIARVLWVLHSEFGFGERRLRRFFTSFDASLNQLVEYYQMEESDDAWLCGQKLTDVGIDFHKWREENR